MKRETAISHYNRLEGVERVLTELYQTALRNFGPNLYEHNLYCEGLLKSITTVKGAQNKLPWNPNIR
jgi:hypothetical protein